MRPLSPVPQRKELLSPTGFLTPVWSTWFRDLFERLKVVRGDVSTSGDENATISPNVYYHAVTALTAGRTLTLPATADCEDGHTLTIQDESGAAGSFAITIQRAGSDTVNGSTSTSISSNYGRRVLIKRGTGWFSA